MLVKFQNPMIAEIADKYNVVQWIWMPISSEKLINKRPKDLCNIYFVIMSFFINVNILIFYYCILAGWSLFFCPFLRSFSSPEPEVMELSIAGLIKSNLWCFDEKISTQVYMYKGYMLQDKKSQQAFWQSFLNNGNWVKLKVLQCSGPTCCFE